MKNESAVIFLLILSVIVLFISVPFVIIWALNAVFSLGIAYTFWTWLGVLALNLTWGGGLSRAFTTYSK